jgi:hypothetical protein
MAKGFNRPTGGNPGGGGMLQQIKKLQEQMEAVQAQLAEETISVTVGGGVLKITMTGDQVCKSVEIDPEFLKEVDVEMLQDMILTGVIQAIEKSRAMAAERLGPLAGGIPGLGF